MTFTVSEDQATAVLTDGALTLRLIAKNSIDCDDCALRTFCAELGPSTACCSALSRRNRLFIIWEEVP